MTQVIENPANTLYNQVEALKRVRKDLIKFRDAIAYLQQQRFMQDPAVECCDRRELKYEESCLDLAMKILFLPETPSNVREKMKLLRELLS